MAQKHPTMPPQILQHADEVAEYGVRLGMRNGRTVWEVECACGKTEQQAWEPIADRNTAVNTALKKFRRIAWGIEFGKPPRCPTCYREDRGEQPWPRRDDMIIDVEPGQVPLPLPAPGHVEPPISAITSNAKAAAAVHKLYAKHFNDGVFDPDWDDDRVSSESGAQKEFCISIRREAYGELAEDPAVTRIKRDLVALKQQHIKQDEQLATLTEMITTARGAWVELDHAIEAIEQRLAQGSVSLTKRRKPTIDEEAFELAKRTLHQHFKPT